MRACIQVGFPDFPMSGCGNGLMRCWWCSSDAECVEQLGEEEPDAARVAEWKASVAHAAVQDALLWVSRTRAFAAEKAERRKDAGEAGGVGHGSVRRRAVWTGGGGEADVASVDDERADVLLGSRVGGGAAVASVVDRGGFAADVDHEF